MFVCVCVSMDVCMYAGIGITRRVEGAASESRRAGTGRRTVERKGAENEIRDSIQI